MSLLDRLRQVKQCLRPQVGVNDNDRVEIRTLFRPSHRVGLVDGRHSAQVDALRCRDLVHCVTQGGKPVAEVAAQRDRCPAHV